MFELHWIWSGRVLNRRYNLIIVLIRLHHTPDLITKNMEKIEQKFNYESFAITASDDIIQHSQHSNDAYEHVNLDRFLSSNARVFYFWHIKWRVSFLFCTRIWIYRARHIDISPYSLCRTIFSDEYLNFSLLCSHVIWMNVIWSNCYDQTISKSSSLVYQRHRIYE